MQSASSVHGIPFGEALRTWLRIGLQSFGGPAGQIAVMHKVLVEQKRWVSESRFLHALNYCMLLPGPEAQQLATYIGWLLHRTLGGIVAGTLFVLPGFVVMLALSALYAGFRQVPLVEALFFGLKPAVLAIVVEAVIRIGRRSLKNGALVALAGGAFVAIFFFGVPFPLIVLAAGAIGLCGARLWPRFFPGPGAPEITGEAEPAVVDRMLAAGELEHTRPSLGRAVRVLLVCLTLWLGPLALLAAIFGRGSVFVAQGLFFSKAAVVTFGGAYAVLAYVAQEAVSTFGWLQPGEMLDGLGMAETTPGPLILVLQFVGFLGAYRKPALLAPMAAGLLGASITVWVTFVPCFLWIFLGAPYIEALRGNRALHASLSAITAAVVGVVLNLSLWFALSTVFARVGEARLGPLRLLVPELGTLSVPALVIAGAALVAMLRFKIGMGWVLAASAATGLVQRLFFGG